MLLLDNIEQQAQDLSRQDQLRLFQFLQQKLFQQSPDNDTAQPSDDNGLTLTEAPEGYEIQTFRSASDAYEAAANLKAWEESLPGPKYLDPEKLMYPDGPIRELTPQHSSDC